MAHYASTPIVALTPTPSTKTGLRATLGKPELLLELLKLFVSSHQDAPEKLRHSLGSGDQKGARLRLEVDDYDFATALVTLDTILENQPALRAIE